MEQVKRENEELRRKEQILQSIPDLIVVFDPTGNITFCSNSVTQFIDCVVDDMQDTSFWDHLTQDSVRLVKNAFMDALAVKTPEGDDSSAPLWNGQSRSVKLVADMNHVEEYTVVNMRGQVHFAGGIPECVCSIRRHDARAYGGLDPRSRNKKMKGCSLSAATRISDV